MTSKFIPVVSKFNWSFFHILMAILWLVVFFFSLSSISGVVILFCVSAELVLSYLAYLRVKAGVNV